MEDLQLRAADVLLPFTSQGELIGLLILGSHLKRDRYTRDELALLDSYDFLPVEEGRIGLVIGDVN